MLTDGSLVAKGEFVVVVQGSAEPEGDSGRLSSDALLAELLEALPGKQAVDIVSRLSGRRRNDVYRDMLAIKGAADDG